MIADSNRIVLSLGTLDGPLEIRLRRITTLLFLHLFRSF
ncbi:hypothetical protein LEP1GSC047_3118 [Leptospira inadai serovar Lyme str. 10]|uniref:Uncharacterized protein n=1 Tax=Leptospira inadai serovar Lyme str. 10 TaxID=1049790 RepID=V6HAU1_9LEPT|nr:hypothetical protein LEP1GSC047_3118 [Leptospira inadai serovar Lyme str. 10]